MNDGDKKKFGVLLFGVAEMFGKDISKNLAELYFDMLKNYSYEQIEDAIKTIIYKSKFFPKIADIVEAINGTSKTDLFTLEAQAEVAYNKLIQARKEYGAYTSVIFDDPVIHRIVEQNGGWPEICYMSHEDEQYKAFKKNFISEYMAFSQDKSYIPPPKLVGITEGANRENGFEDEIPEPVYIGDKKKALEWTQKAKQIKAEKQKVIQGKVVDMNEVKAIAKSMAV